MQEQLDDPEFVVEYKIDGLSMTLRYENGELALAETRGDGINFGEDVTANAKVIGDVKKKLTGGTGVSGDPRGSLHEECGF